MKRRILLVIALVTFVLAQPLAAAAQEPKHGEPGAAPATAAPHDAAQPTHEGAAHAGHGEAEGSESAWATIARLFNFAVLAGILVYLMRSPFAAFLEGRKTQIRKSLSDAADTREAASRQLAVIDKKLKDLPAELEALKQRGTAEIAAEEARIRQTADVERQRILENARREIERRAYTAERRLLKRAGELAVSVATERVKRTITEADQVRLVDRYLQQVRPETIGS